MSRISYLVGRFSGVHRWPVLGVRRGLEQLFISRGILYDVIDGNSADLSGLRAAYESDAYDVLWAVSHGEVEHFEVHESTFGQVASVEDWAGWRVPNNGRRLLVLNMCDSSTAAMLGGLGDSGLAASVASGAQAVVGNLWPVSTGLSSIFSVLLADLICGSESFLAAYEQWVRVRLAGVEALLQKPESVKYLPADLVKVLKDSSEDWSPMFAWGSASFHS